MLSILSRYWWVMTLRGIAAILFGLVAVILPQPTLVVLVLLFGAFMLVEGVFALIAALQAARRKARWWPFLLEGLAALALGILTFIWPGITAIALVYLIALWALVTGLFRLILAVRLRHEIPGEWLLGLSGIIGMLFGVLLLISPGEGAIALVLLIGMYALLIGLLVLILSFRLRKLGRRIEEFQGRMSES